MRDVLVAMCCAGLLMVAGCGGDDGTPAIDAPSGTDAPPGIDAPPGGLSCADYCASVTANCTGANAQYGGPATCMASCATWMTGTAGEQSGNTLACRTYHAGVAAGNPGLHCRHAGPGGDGACGTNCEGFCTLVLGVCTGGNEVYADMLTCTQACAGFATTPPYDATVQSGNSLACRLYHATAASTSPGGHCGHTDVVSTTCQ